MNKTPIIINYPITHPATKLENGAVVPGYLAPDEMEFSPFMLREEYEKKNNRYKLYPEHTDGRKNISNEYIELAQHRRDMARFLDEKYSWDLLAVQFQVTDSIFHDITDRCEIKRVLKNVDQFVGDIINIGGDDTDVFIASDHGMGDYEWTFYVNSWLAENSYCETTTGEEQYFRQAKDELKGKSGDERPSSIASAVGSAADALSAIGLSPRRIHRGLGAVGLDKTVERLLPEDALVAAQNQVVDHENSIAYQLLFNSLGIHLNVEGREPNGKVSPEEYDDVREELIEELTQIRDPDGNLVFDDVLPREEVYEGPHLEDAPDIVLVPRDYQYDVSGSIVDTFRRNPHKNHKPEGILISNRDLNVDPEEEASIYDVAPTVAAALGLPVDTKTDGEVLGPFDADKWADWDDLAGKYREVSKSENGPTDDVEDRLADLGYME
jgi:predicted AlkP superfamily phosphohydrolase/phosphomutase